MTRAPFVAFAAAVAALGGGLFAAVQEPAYRGAAHLVPIYATVVDPAGRLVPGLSADDFVVEDDGVPQVLTVFDNSRQPITIVIMLDRSGSMTDNFAVVRDAARALIATLGDADRARLGTFSRTIQIDPPAFTSDHAALNQVLENDLQPPGPTPLWNATAQAMNALGAEAGRRVVLLFTDGVDFPGGPGPDTTFDAVARQAESDGVMVYAIGLSDGCAPDDPPGQPGRGGRGGFIPASFQRGRGRPMPRLPGPVILVPSMPPPVGPTPPPSGPGDGGGNGSDPFGRHTGESDSGCSPERPDANLATLARASGGGYVELRTTDNLAATFARVADELHHQYLLGFRAATLDGRTHAVDVQLRDQPNLTVHARTSYVATPAK